MRDFERYYGSALIVCVSLLLIALLLFPVAGVTDNDLFVAVPVCIAMFFALVALLLLAVEMLLDR